MSGTRADRSEQPCGHGAPMRLTAPWRNLAALPRFSSPTDPANFEGEEANTATMRLAKHRIRRVLAGDASLAATALIPIARAGLTAVHRVAWQARPANEPVHLVHWSVAPRDDGMLVHVEGWHRDEHGFSEAVPLSRDEMLDEVATCAMWEWLIGFMQAVVEARAACMRCYTFPEVDESVVLTLDVERDTVSLEYVFANGEMTGLPGDLFTADEYAEQHL